MRKTLPISKLFLYPILFTSLFFTSPTKAQTDIDFWFAAPEVSTSTQTFDVPIVIRMTTEGTAATVTISQPAGGGMPNQVVNIPANSTQSVDLSTWLAVIESQPGNTNLNYGLRIQSTAPITAYYEVVSLACLCNPEIFVLKGKNALGLDFWIPSQTLMDNNQSYNPAPRSSFDIIATENNTTVTITPSNDIIGHVAGVPFNITLNVGQVYSATAVNWQAALHLQGSRVTANKKIAITVKDDLLTGTYGSCADLAGDQIVPSNIIGSNYIAMNGALNAPNDQLFITATQNNTAITQDGVLQTTINSGQTYQTAVGGSSSYIQTSNPAYVYQLSGIGCEVGTAILPQIDCSGSTSVSFNRSSPNDLYINVMVQAGGQGNFTVNGAPGVVTAAQFNAVPGTANQWFAAQVALPVGTYPQGSVIVVANSTNSFHLGVLDGSVSSGARFGYFSNYGGVPSQATTTTYDICAGEDILLFADTTDGATYSWTGPNSFNSTTRNPVIAGATVGHTGTYYLVVTANGCISPADTVNITVHAKPAPPITNYKQNYCTNETFQPFSISGQNLTYYDAAVGGTATFTQPTINVSNPGTYNVWVTQTQNGCESDRAQIVVNVYPEITPAYTYTINYSCTRDTVHFTNTSTGATEYSWYFGDGSPVDHNIDPVHVYDTGVYTVLLVAKNPNCKDTISQVINMVHPLKAAFNTSADTICQHSSISFTDASIYSTPTSVMPTYQWNFGDGGTDFTQNPVYIFDRVGTYQVSMMITDFVPCKSFAFKTVVVDSMSTLVLSVDTNSVCVGEAIRIRGDYTEIGLNSLTWDFGDGIIDSEIGNPVTHDYQTYGSYTIKLANDYRVCPDLNAEIPVTVRPTPIIALGPDTTICPNGASYVLHDLINSTNPSAQWLWNTGETTFSIGVKEANTYWGRVSVDGCMATDSVWVKKDCYIDVPNAFTPDGDGISDYFFPRQWLSMSVTSFSMIIYNRWGQEIFNTTNIGGRGWDGKFNSVDQPQGVYIYTIDVKFKNGVSEHKQGNVTLLR